MLIEFNLMFILRSLSGFLALALILGLMKRRSANGVIFLILFEFAAAIWALSDGFEHAATSLGFKIFWSQIGYLGSSTTSIFFLLFTLAYTQLYRQNSFNMVALLMAIPVITILLVFTYPQNHLIWEKVEFYPETNESAYIYGKWFWVFAIYEYFALVSAIGVLLIGTYHFFKTFKIQLVYLIIASVLPLITSIFYVFKLTSLRADLTPIALIFSGGLAALGIYYQRMFDVVPIARKQTINKLSDGVMVVDMANRIVDVNQAFENIINTQREDLLGIPVLRFSNLFVNEESLHPEENDYVAETTIPTPSGLRYYEVKYSRVTDSKNKLIGKIYLLHDISIRKKALDEAIETNVLLRNEIIEKEKLIADLDAYARSVAHDLKNPISGMIGLTDFIKDYILSQNATEALELLDMVNTQSQKMVEIVDELLLLSRIRKEDIVSINIDMYSIVKEAVGRLKRLAESRGAIIEYPEEWPVVMGHSQWIEEVWVNLISNAIKYGGDPPKIVMGSEKAANGFFSFWISDNGPGLSPEFVNKLFMDFERLGQKQVEGHGLGLSIAKRIIEKLGGKVFVTSENIPGKGCTFSFLLPE
ncbi:MAG: histidine kinase N-terminal 7TM domain-containing protein [Mariniphaga sp.]